MKFRNNFFTFMPMKYFRNYLYAVLWGVVMMGLFLMPTNDVNKIPLFEGVDKIIHCGLFFILTCVLYWENLIKYNWKVRKWYTITKVVIFTILFAISTELAQLYLTSFRSADIWDLVADAIGIGMASFAFLLFVKRT